MKLKKTKSAVAVLLAVMLLLSTMIMAPVSASAATAGESVGANKQVYGSASDYVRYGFSVDGLNTVGEWSNSPVRTASQTYPNTGIDGVTTTYLSTEIQVPENMNHIHCVFHAGYDLGDDRYYKLGAAGAPAWPYWQEVDQQHWAYNQQGYADITINVVPGSKIQFRFIRFEQDGECLVYSCNMTELPATASETTKLGDVAISVEPESAPYSESRNVSINVTNIDSRIPLDEITVGYNFEKGTFTPANADPVKDETNHTITITGTLSGFTEADVKEGYVATATAETDYIYYDQGQHKVIGFEADPATDTYDIEAATPSIVPEYFYASLSLSKSNIYADEATTLTATVPFPEHMPASSYADVGLTVNDDQYGQHFLTADSSAIVDGKKVYTFTLPANTYNAADSPITFTANASYNGNDYTDAATNTTYHFVAVNPTQTRLTVSEPPYNTVTEAIGVSVSVAPASTEYDGTATVTVVLTAPTDFPNAKTNLMSATVTDSTGKDMPTPTTSVDTNAKTVTQVYTLQAGRYSASDIGDVVFTGTAVLTGSADFTDTANRINYVFTDGATATATLDLTGKNGEVPVIKNIEGGGIQLDVTPERDLYSVARDASVVVNNIDAHIYAEYGNFDNIVLTLTDSKNKTFTETANARTKTSDTSFTTSFDIPSGTYTAADAGIVTYTVTANYTGGDIYDSTDGTTYSFTDGQTATDTSELINNTDTNLNIRTVDSQLKHKLHMRYFTGQGNFRNYKNVYLIIRNTTYGNGTSFMHIDGVLENGRYKFECDMTPTQITDIMELTVYATNTTNQIVYNSTTRRTTIASYLYNRLDTIKDSTDEGDVIMRSAIVDLLNYGSALQVMLNYHTDNLANTRLKSEFPNYSDYSLTNYDQEDEINTTYRTIDNPQMWFSSHTLFFDDSINPVIYFKATQNGREMTDTDYLDVVISGISTKVYLKDMNYESQQQRYKYMFTDLTSNQVDRNIIFTLRDKDGNALSNTMLYNVSSNLPKRAASAVEKGTASSIEEYYNSTEGQALIYTIKFGRSAKMLGDYQATHP